MSIVTPADSTSAAPVLLPLRVFLKTYAISKSEFYRMAARGEAPDVFRLGRRTLIPAASAAAWLAARIVPASTISQARA
jgi:predicted DNA-binding transcriptional regulator AlpA